MKESTSKHLAKTLKSGREATKFQNDIFEKDFLMKTTTSAQLAKTLKSGLEAGKLQNEGFVNGLPYENKHFQAAGSILGIWPSRCQTFANKGSMKVIISKRLAKT